MSDNIIIKKLPSGSAEPATPSEAGVVKLYDSLGSNTDGTINQSFISEEINGINEALDSLPPSLFLDRSAEVTAATNQEIQDAFDTGKQICIEGENGLVYLSASYGESIIDAETAAEIGYVGYLIFAEGKEFIYFLEIETDENNDFVSGAWFNSIEDVIPDIMYPDTFSETLRSLNQVVMSDFIECDPDLVGADMGALIVTTQIGQSMAYYFNYNGNDYSYMDMSVELNLNYPILDAFIYLNENGFSSETEISYSQMPLLACNTPETYLHQYRFGSPQAYVPFKTVSQDGTHYVFEGTINNNLVTVDIEVDWENHSAQITQTSTEISGGGSSSDTFEYTPSTDSTTVEGLYNMIVQNGVSKILFTEGFHTSAGDTFLNIPQNYTLRIQQAVLYQGETDTITIMLEPYIVEQANNETHYLYSVILGVSGMVPSTALSTALMPYCYRNEITSYTPYEPE